MKAKLIHASVAVAFILGISLPMVTGLIEPDLKVSEAENRTLSERPTWPNSQSPKEYFGLVTAYAADHFGFRENLIRLNTKLKWSLGYSPSPKVIRGRDDWLFLKTIDPLLSQHQYGLEAVEKGLSDRAEYVRTMQTNLAERGIAYQMIIAANKMNVYEEYLPAKYALTNIRASYDKYKEHFSADELEKQVFSEEVLNAQKSKFDHDFYYKNDTHWNDLGAYKIFAESLRKLQISHPAIKFDAPQKEFKPKLKKAGDLANYLSLGSQLNAMEPATTFRKCARRKAVTAFRKGVNQSTCNRNDTVVVVIGDSFMPYIVPYYAESVGKVYMVTQTFSRRQLAALIDEVKPTLVIEQLVERSLPGKVP